MPSAGRLDREAAADECCPKGTQEEGKDAAAAEGGDGRGSADGGFPETEDREHRIPGAQQQAEPGTAALQTESWQGDADVELSQGQCSKHLSGDHYNVHACRRAHIHYSKQTTRPSAVGENQINQ